MFGTAYVRWDAPGYHQSMLPLDFPSSQNFQIIAPSSGPERSSKPLWDWNFEGQPTYYGVLRWATSKPYVSRMHITLTCPVAYLCNGKYVVILMEPFRQSLYYCSLLIFIYQKGLCTKSPRNSVHRSPRSKFVHLANLHWCSAQSSNAQMVNWPKSYHLSLLAIFFPSSLIFLRRHIHEPLAFIMLFCSPKKRQKVLLTRSERP